MKKTSILCILVIAFALTSNSQQYQLLNPGFEQWDGNNTSEPTHWNTFSSSDGSYASLASSNHHYRRAGGRPGTSGSYYLTVYTTSIFGIKANGNMTTGCVHAGAMSATSSENYNYTKRSSSEHSQPFTATPDSMYVWVSFYAADASSVAQVSVTIHGNNDFRTPNDESNATLYKGKALAYVTRTTSSATQPNWQLQKVPFSYTGSSTANYILVNISSNIIPGGGAANDSISVDDIVFIYNAWLNNLKVNNTPIAGFSKGRFNYTVAVTDTAALSTATVQAVTEVSDAHVNTERTRIDDSTAMVTVTVTAEDGVTVKTYHVTLTVSPNGGTSGIDNAQPALTEAFPNPTTGILNIHAEGLVRICDLQGRTLLSLTCHESATIDISHLPNGIYLLSTEEKTVRIIKQ